jgi:hypothetical protein
LLARLPKTGPVILNRDGPHFQTGFDHRYVPAIGSSKGTNSQDEAVNKAEAAIINKLPPGIE